MNKFERYQYNIFTICGALHSSNTGSSDPLDKDAEKNYVDFLQMRLDTWQPPLYSCKIYDGAVELLIRATLYENRENSLGSVE